MLSNDSFLHYLASQCNIKKDDKLLVAVSGGADSMALLHLLHANGLLVEAAHVNFMLRGAESDGDQTLVEAYCREVGVMLHINQLDAAKEARETGKSIEMAARDLRYDWFSSLIVEDGFKCVAVGHHSNDSIETFFINLIRGTGVHGLTGIKPVMGHVVRPLLFASRNDILAYCNHHQIPWRTDSSNLSNDFVRNRIRNEILPMMAAINPSFEQTMQQNMARLGQLEAMLADMVLTDKTDMVADSDGTMLIPIKLLKAHKHCSLFLFELLKDKGFNAAQIDDIVKSLDGIAGKQFLSDSHRVVRDRDNLIVTQHDVKKERVYYVESGQEAVVEPIELQLSTFERPDDFLFSVDRYCAHFDASKVDFPLTIRRWCQGDVFMPLGLGQFKKLSDFFIDNKFSLIDKENAWLLLSGDEIIWVMGHRLDDRYKVTPKTKQILEIKIASY